MRSSNSPLYFDFATRPDISSDTRRFPAMSSGTVPFTILCARPSTIAVFPTPGSPIRHGLFLPRLHKICITLNICLSLPMTGSNSPFSANSVRSLEYWSRVGVCDAPALLFCSSSLYLAGSSPIAVKISTYIFCILTFIVLRSRAAAQSPCEIIAISICSVPTSSYPKCSAISCALSRTLSALGVIPLFSAIATPSPGEMRSFIIWISLS